MLYGMLQLSDNFQLFHEHNLQLALLSPNIPQNQAKFEVGNLSNL